MILLDTNLISELFLPAPAPQVLAWAQTHKRTRYFSCAPVLAEIRYGVIRLAASERKKDLAERYHSIVASFRGRILPFDLDAAEAFADITVARSRAGRYIGIMDATIVAIAKARGAALATRNVNDFENCGVMIIDPWAYKG